MQIIRRLISLALMAVPLFAALPLFAQPTGPVVLKPVGDTRCLVEGSSPASGQWTLGTCGSSAEGTFQSDGQIEINGRCVVSDENRVYARPCNDTTVDWKMDWKYVGTDIQLLSKPSKCLSISGNLGTLRAVLQDCSSSLSTDWNVVSVP